MLRGALAQPYWTCSFVSTGTPNKTQSAYRCSTARPSRPPVAPVAAIRAWASCSVSQVTLYHINVSAFLSLRTHLHRHAYLVPGLFTRGSATHCSVAAQGEMENVPPTHCASFPPTHAVSPVVHEELAVRVWNWRLRACASCPFLSVNAARRFMPPVTPAETVATVRERGKMTSEKRIASSRLVFVRNEGECGLVMIH